MYSRNKMAINDDVNGTTTNETTPTSTASAASMGSLSSTTKMSVTIPVNQSECGIDLLGECVSSGQEYFSFIVGVLSIVLWIGANYHFLKARRRQGIMVTGHMIYIIQLVLADSMYLLGAILCDQLGTQVLTAIFLVICDVIFLFVLTYTWHRQRAAARMDEILNNNWNDKNVARGPPNGTVIPVCCLMLPMMVSLFAPPIRSLYSSTNLHITDEEQMIGRKLLMVTESSVDNFGFALGVTAALLYATVRITTIKDAIYRKDVIRPELAFHGIAVAACLTYCCSVISYSVDYLYIINALPWLCGMALMGIEDILIVFMTWRFTRSNSRVPRVKPRVEDGTMLLNNGDGGSVNFEPEERIPSSVNTRRTPPLTVGNKLFLEVTEKGRSDSVQTENSFVADDDDGATRHQTPSDMVQVQNAVQVQVISYPHLQKTAGPEEDLFMDKQNLRPNQNKEFEDDFEWDFSDINQQFDDSGPKWNTEEWDEETVLKEIEDELRQADEDRASTSSLSYNGQQEHEDDMYHVL